MKLISVDLPVPATPLKYGTTCQASSIPAGYSSLPSMAMIQNFVWPSSCCVSSIMSSMGVLTSVSGCSGMPVGMGPSSMRRVRM